MTVPDFQHLVEEYYSPLYRFAVSLGKEEPDACALTQQTFMIWAAEGHQLRDPSKIKTWLFTTLYREFLAAMRDEQQFGEVEEDTGVVDAPQMEASMANALDGAIIQDALHRLHFRYRGPVSLFYLKQHSYREIAEILEIPIDTVLSRISRGKAELRKALSSPAPDEAKKHSADRKRGNRNE